MPAATESSGQTEERTALLLERLLQIARVSALEEMASGIAHELNQPMGAIATFAQAAQRMLNRPDPMVRCPTLPDAPVRRVPRRFACLEQRPV